MIADTPHAIDYVRLCALKGAVKMEAVGLKRRGRSATMIAKEELGLSRGTKREIVIQKLEEKIQKHLENK